MEFLTTRNLLLIFAMRLTELFYKLLQFKYLYTPLGNNMKILTTVSDINFEPAMLSGYE